MSQVGFTTGVLAIDAELRRSGRARLVKLPLGADVRPSCHSPPRWGRGERHPFPAVNYRPPGGCMPDTDAPTESPEQTGFEGMLARAAAKDRTHIQRHLATADAEPDAAHAALWRRLATMLFGLAPLPIQTVGHSAVLFFVPDGKYRMQMFALEDQSDGRIALYLPDVLN